MRKLTKVPDDMLAACREVEQHYAALQQAIEQQDAKALYNAAITINQASGTVMSLGWRALYGPKQAKR